MSLDIPFKAEHQNHSCPDEDLQTERENLKMKNLYLNGSGRILIPLVFSMACVIGLLALCMSCNEENEKASQSLPENVLDITILHTNDMHSHMLGFAPNSD